MYVSICDLGQVRKVDLTASPTTRYRQCKNQSPLGQAESEASSKSNGNRVGVATMRSKSWIGSMIGDGHVGPLADFFVSWVEGVNHDG